MLKPLIFVSVCLMAVSCKKEDTTPTTSAGPILASLSFKLDGVTYAPLAQSTQHTSGKIFIAGSQSVSDNCAISISDTLTPGTYNFSSTGIDGFRMSYTPDNFTTSYVSVSGTGTVVSHDFTNRRIQATFNCMLVSSSPNIDTIYVTNGEINKTYPQ